MNKLESPKIAQNYLKIKKRGKTLCVFLNSNEMQQGLPRETEFFKYNPLAFVEDLTDACRDLCSDVADSLESKIKQEKRITAKSDDQIFEEVEKMVEVLLASFTKNFGTLQNYMLQQFFTIPPDVVTHPPPAPPPTDLHIPTQEEEEELDLELQQLYKKKLDQNAQLKTLREAKINLQQKTAAMVELRDKLEKLAVEKNIEDMHSEIPEIINVLGALHNAVSEIRTHKI
eukprot:Phypoly_transcript_16974.p1 GENE.Phypoly_transcript_16974~~Phypoly_transcript_16974.p1  ORF type:complete len:229 (+),score=53.48 Phypoly_transcript_16974:68-754(+)